MTGSVFGKSFQIMTFGESHGKAVGVVIDGIKPGLKISEKDIQRELDRRKPGQSKVSSARSEEDRVEILSGIFNGKTTGTPIAMVVWNKDIDSSKYEKIKALFRPGHADYTYLKKYGIRDYRGGGRSSGRETVGRVAAGAVAKKILAKKKIRVLAYTIQVGDIFASSFDEKEIGRNPVRCPDKRAAKRMERLILKARQSGDSLGGIVEVVAKNVPAGLGEPVFGKLDAELAKALVGIGAVKGVEFGAGFAVAELMGSECNDGMRAKRGKVRFLSNSAGGILGGISSGQDIVVRIAVKPTASIALPQKTIGTSLKNRIIRVEGRHDPCICPRIVPVAESMAAIVLADALLVQESRKRK